MAYELALEYYEGPIHKLLELIEEQKIEVTRVSLVKVTGDFLKYIETLEAKEKNGGVSSLILADFLVVASKLVLLKSKALLPSLELNEEEESELRDLEARLKIYEALKPTQTLIREKWSVLPQMWSREFLTARKPVFYPPARAGAAELHAALLKVLGELERIMKPTKIIKMEIINLKKKIEEIIARIKKTPLKFQDLHAGRSREELVVLFLAVLHLIKQQFVDVRQQDNFGEITIAQKRKLT